MTYLSTRFMVSVVATLPPPVQTAHSPVRSNEDPHLGQPGSKASPLPHIRDPLKVIYPVRRPKYLKTLRQRLKEKNLVGLATVGLASAVVLELVSGIL